MRIVKILFLLFLGCIVTGLLFRQASLAKITTLALERAGAHDIRVQVEQLGISRTRLHALHTVFPLPSGTTLSLSLQGIEVTYSLKNLLTTGKCRAVTIDSLEINQQSDGRIRQQPFTFPEKISLLHDSIRTSLPVKELHINRLRFKGDWPAQLIDKNIRLNASLAGTTLSAFAALELTNEISITTELQSPDARHAKMVTTARNSQKTFFSSNLALAPDKLSGTVSMQLAPVRALILNETDMDSLPDINGHLTGTFSLPLPLMNSADILADFILHDTSTNDISLNARGNPTTKKLTFTINGRNSEGIFLTTNLTLRSKKLAGDFRFNAAQIQQLLRPYLSRPLPDIQGEVEGLLDIPLPGSRDSNYTLSAQATNLSMPRFSGASLNIQADGEMTAEGFTMAKNSSIRATDVVLAKYKMQDFSLGLAGYFHREEDRFILHIKEGQSVDIKKLSSGGFFTEALSAQLKQPLHLTRQGKEWQVRPTLLSTDQLQITEKKRSYSSGPLQVNLSRFNGSVKGLELDAQVSTPSLIYKDTRTIPLKNLAGTLQLKKNIFNAKIEFSPEKIPGRMELKLTHNLATASGNLHLKTSKRCDFDKEGTTLADIFSPWEFPFNLDRGKLSFTADGRWRPHKPFRLASFVTVTKGDGFYKKFMFKGLSIRQDLAVLPRLYSKSEGNFALRKLIGGIDIYDTRAKLNFARSAKGRKPLIRISDFQASLFAGIVSSPEIIYDQNKPDSDFTVKIHAMDLEEIVGLLKTTSLRVSGKISGVIPVKLRNKDISVDNGELFNEPPGGEIHYTTANINSTGVAGYALKAVENFVYDSLKTKANYSPSGQLDLDIALQGISPSLNTTRKVHLNIHAEQNLPALLQSLRFSKGLTEELDKQVKDHYK